MAARRMDLSARQITEAEQVALLHDVGKVAVPDHILQKPGPLDAEERELIETHPVVGARIVRSIAGLAHLAPAIRAGHERWDGAATPTAWPARRSRSSRGSRSSATRGTR